MAEWSLASRVHAREIHQKYQWKVSLNWHLVSKFDFKFTFFQLSFQFLLTDCPLGGFRAYVWEGSKILGLGDGANESQIQGAHLHDKFQGS